MRSCATTSRSLSLLTFFRNSATSPGCSTSSCSAAPRTASMQLLQEQSAGIPGATAALTPVPITRRRSRGCFLTRLFKNFLEHKKQKCSLFTAHFLACLKSSGTDSRSLPEPLKLLQNTNQQEQSSPFLHNRMRWAATEAHGLPQTNNGLEAFLPFQTSKCAWLMPAKKRQQLQITSISEIQIDNCQFPGHWASQTPFPMKFWKK